MPEVLPSLNKNAQVAMYYKESYLVIMTEFGAEVDRRQKDKDSEVPGARSVGLTPRPDAASTSVLRKQVQTMNSKKFWGHVVPAWVDVILRRNMQ